MVVNENPIFEKAVNKLVYVSADEQLRYELDMREKAELDYWSAMKTNYRKGKLEGREEGAEEKAYRTICRALKRGAKPEDISYDLEVPISRILEIKKKISVED